MPEWGNPVRVIPHYLVASFWLLVTGKFFMNSYKDLDVYKRAYDLAIKIHRLSSKFPKELQYDLGDQIRRASRSIPSNIAEGFGRNKSAKDKINFLNNSLGSNDEVIFNLEFIKDIDLITQEVYKSLFEEYTICGKQLFNLIKSIK